MEIGVGMGPTILFDKSFLQSLTLDEAVIFDHFFIAVICPMFYVETLADLEKKVRPERTPEDEVRIIAQKTPEMQGAPCAYHINLCGPNLLGQQVPMTGQIPIIGGKAVKVGDQGGVVFEERPELEALRRWQAEEFFEVERRFAKAWRANLNAPDTLTIVAGLKAMGIDVEGCGTLDEAKALADQFVAAQSMPYDRIKLAIMALGLPPESEPLIAKKWEKSSFQPLIKYAPYAAHVLTVELFFHIALQANLVTRQDKQDISYLSYLPFSYLFVSSDKLHRQSAPPFLRTDQKFVWGQELKADLKTLVEHYKSLPEEEQEKALMNVARVPPEGSVIATLWNDLAKIMKQQEQEELRNLFDAPPVEEQTRNATSFPKAEGELVKHLKRFHDAPELSPSEIDFDMTNPDVLSVKRAVRKRRGSFWQLPKNLKKPPDQDK
jgi:hypothetical protein